MNVEYKNLKSFFLQDLKIKRYLYEMCVPELDSDDLIKYTDDTYQKLMEIIDIFSSIIENLNLYGMKSHFEELANKWIELFINCKNDRWQLQFFYKTYVVALNEKFVDSVKEECMGYYFFRSCDSIYEVHSLNELLHLMHTYIMNNEQVYHDMPKIAEKSLLNKEKITLYGEDNAFFHTLFNLFPIDIGCGITDIVSFGEMNKTIIMIRDLGHALTIELDIESDNVIIHYYIPKICNVDMVNALPGLNRKVNSTDEHGATGIFHTTIFNMYNDLFNFLRKVPTDKDIIVPDFRVK